ncbi:MAG: ATP-binding protein [Caldilineaceae bacterium]|nr:ATP-binding protein [Caldilineaceae bacterium]
MIERLQRIPFSQKILLANSLIVAMGAVAGTVITVWHVTSYPEEIHYELIAFFALGGWLISFVVNNWVLKQTLTPLDRLQSGVDDVRSGRRDVQVISPPISDDRFDRLIDTFNQMVRQQEADARRLHSLSQRILQAQEDERQRVARELHDEAAQALTSLLVRLRLLERARTPEEAQARVGELRELTAAALDEVRRVALDLRPKILDDLGLVAALGWRVDEFNAANAAQAALRVEGIEHRLPHTLELVFYRVAQEALNNAARHANATTVQMLLAMEGGTLSLQVTDNGAGFDSATQPNGGSSRHGGLGLLGIRERMEMIGGQLRIDSAPGRGTRLLVSAPVGESHG